MPDARTTTGAVVGVASPVVCVEDGVFLLPPLQNTP